MFFIRIENYSNHHEADKLTYFYHILLTRWGVFSLMLGIFSLTEHTDLTDPFCAPFRTHRRPPAYRIHRTLQLKVAVRFCVIGWLNVSVKLCVFCSSVFFCEKKNNCETCLGGFFSHRAQRVHGGFWRTFRAHRTPSAYRDHRALLLKVAVMICEIGWLNLTVGIWV